ncbi:uncharacterized protein EHS24_009161 [Apiotrichum porosum]|uniref:PAS domain-containing protein n=1 Tax=Apiotrichum porosum TaxID=105984 RepID=A0A427XNT8_9TREE|nr:uncharacterized protein EHS24_009161 [Apiotrichum porosum]RSH80579.1 hypothetical protein EHS24_009161 [Apiotrichum porosum]
MFVLTAEWNALITYASESVQEILGYETYELRGKTSYLIFHPDEIMALKEAHYSTVYNLIVGTLTRAVNGPNHSRLAATAREVVELRGGRRLSNLDPWSSPRLQYPGEVPPWMLDPESEWPRPEPIHRTLFLLDRFTDAVRIMFASNELIVGESDAAIALVQSVRLLVEPYRTLKDQSFYCIVLPSERAKVRQWVESSKTWTPIVYDNERTGGYG